VRIPPPALARDRTFTSTEDGIMAKGNNAQNKDKKKPKKKEAKAKSPIPKKK
jgi:hypothetical protein